jgi:hypothetical protein
VAVIVGVFVGVEVGPPPVMAKLALLISKKILLAHFTFHRAVVVAILGTVTEAEPLFATLEATVLGKVLPPSVDTKILTLAQLTGAAVVLATFHVTVWVEPPG